MKKILILSTVLAIASWGFVSCNKQTNTKVVDSQTNNNGSGGSTFNWSGTEPLSAKVNGVPFQAVSATVTSFAGYWSVIGKAADNSSINLSIPAGSLPGQIFSAPTPANVGWQSTTTGPFILLMANPGKMKVVTNNSTTLEGYFWADTKDITGASDSVVIITEGYFKVDKP